MAIQIKKGKLNRPQRILLYGVEGIGKSTLAAQAPKPFFIDTEDGTGHLNVDRVQVKNVEDLREAINYLRSGTEYKTAVIDTADNLNRMVAEHVIRREKWRNIEQPGYGKGHVIVTAEYNEIMSSILQLINSGLNVILVAHAKIERISPPDNPEYTKYMPKINAPNKQAEAARELILENCDAVLFAHYELAVRSDGEKPGRAIGEQSRRIYAASAPAWQAKNRHGLPAENAMTADIWAKIFTTEKPEISAENRALLTGYFVASGRLNEGQKLEDLPSSILSRVYNNLPGAIAAAKGITR